MQLPCTYMRSDPVVGAAAAIAGYTAATLLLSPSYLGNQAVG